MKKGICLPSNHPYTKIIEKYDKNKYNTNSSRTKTTIKKSEETEENIMTMWNFVKKLLSREDIDEILKDKFLSGPITLNKIDGKEKNDSKKEEIKIEHSEIIKLCVSKPTNIQLCDYKNNLDPSLLKIFKSMSLINDDDD
jgi:hypothetical protein